MKIRKKTIFLNLAIFVTLFLNAQEYAMNLSDVSNNLDFKI